jgi:tetratricopeptide (TPR) repeat protein
MPSNSISMPLPSAPYRGIEPFRFIDQPIFAAREEEIQKLIRLITIYRGILFYGESGAGKSSLINAGLIPALLDEGFRPERLRVQPVARQELLVERISLTHEGKPPFLPSSFTQQASSSETEPARTVWSLEAFARRIEEIRQPVSGDADRNLGDPLVLIFDQFEEIVTLVEETPDSRQKFDQARDVREQIMALLLALYRDADLPLKLIFSFREDYLARTLRLLAAAPQLRDQTFRLTAPSEAMLSTIIRRPFDNPSIPPGHFKRHLSDPACAALESAFRQLSDTGQINLTEVQIACLALWESAAEENRFVDEKDHREAVRRLFGNYLDRALNGLDKKVRTSAIAALTRLVTSGGTRNIVSEDDLLNHLTREEHVSESDAHAVLEALAGTTRLVFRQTRGDTAFYEITSEFLIPWIREKRLAREATDLRNRLRRTRATVAIMAILIVLAVLAAIYAFSQRETARTALARAEQVVENVTSNLKNSLEPLGHIEVLEPTVLDLLRLYQERREELEYQRHRGALLNLLGQIYFTHGRLQEAFQQYEQSLKTRRAVLEKHKEVTNCQQEVADSLAAMGAVYSAMGELDVALSSYNEDLKIRKELSETFKDRPEMTMRYAQCLYSVGDLLKTLGRFDEAQKQYDKGLAIFDEVFEKTRSANAKQAFATGLCTQGDTLCAQGKTNQALEKYSQSEQLRQKLVDNDRNNVSYQSDLAVSWSCLGDTHRTLGLLDVAKADYEQSLAIREKLLSNQPQNVFQVADYAVSLSNIGDIHLASGEFPLALQSYEKSLDYRQKNSNPEDLNRMADLAIGLASKGDALLKVERPNDALEAYQKSLEIRQQIVTKEPDAVLRMADLAASFWNVGDALLQRGSNSDAGAAVENYKKSLQIYEDLAKKEPSNIYRQLDVAYGRGNLGEGLLRLGDAEGALSLFHSSKTVLEQRMLVDGNNVQIAQDVARAFLRTGTANLALGDKESARSALDQAAAILDSKKDKLDSSGRRLKMKIETERANLPL